MDRAIAKARLKEQLRHDVASLYQRDGREWNKPIAETLRLLREANVRAVFFGGTLRSLILSRVQSGRFGRPRDVDIVVSGTTLEQLRHQFHDSIRRETRFGGLQLERMSWQFDVWPLEQTWAFKTSGDLEPHFSRLPSTTFFNLEAIAVDVWAPPGQPRAIYSGDDQFFDGILDQVLEINREENPFPMLCVVRSLVFISMTGFSIGPRLAHYLAQHSAGVSDNELADAQVKHYGRVRVDRDLMRRWLDDVASAVAANPGEAVRLARPTQMTFWPEQDSTLIRLHLCGAPWPTDSSTPSDHPTQDRG
ncbi:MAG: hypothetical protein U0638_14215 [Phycisphaerales bacterium]